MARLRCFCFYSAMQMRGEPHVKRARTDPSGGGVGGNRPAQPAETALTPRTRAVEDLLDGFECVPDACTYPGPGLLPHVHLQSSNVETAHPSRGRELQRSSAGPPVERELLRERLQQAIEADSFDAVARKATGLAKGKGVDVSTAAYLRTLLRRVYSGSAAPAVFDPAVAAEHSKSRRSTVADATLVPAPVPRLSSMLPEPRPPLLLAVQPRVQYHAPQLASRQPGPPVHRSALTGGAASSSGGGSSAVAPLAVSTTRRRVSATAAMQDKAPAQAAEGSALHVYVDATASTGIVAANAPEPSNVAPRSTVAAESQAAEAGTRVLAGSTMDSSVMSALRKLDPLRMAASSWTSSAAPAAVRREVDLRAEGRRAVLGALPSFHTEPLHALLDDARAAVSAERDFMSPCTTSSVADMPEVDVLAAPEEQLLVDSPEEDFEAFAARISAAVDQRASEEMRAAAGNVGAQRRAQMEADKDNARTITRLGARPVTRATSQPRGPVLAFGSNLPRFPQAAPTLQGPAVADAESQDVGSFLAPLTPARTIRGSALALTSSASGAGVRGVRVGRSSFGRIPMSARSAARNRRTGLVAEIRARMERVTAAAAAAAVTHTAATLASQHEAAIRAAAAQLSATEQQEQAAQLAEVQSQLLDALLMQQSGDGGARGGLPLDAEAVKVLVRDIVASETARAIADMRARVLASASSALAPLAPQQATPVRAQGSHQAPSSTMTPPGGTPQPLLGSVTRHGMQPSAARVAAERVLAEWSLDASVLEPVPTPASSGSSSGGRAPPTTGVTTRHMHDGTPATWSSSTPSSGLSGAAPWPPRLRDVDTPTPGDATGDVVDAQSQRDIDLAWVELSRTHLGAATALPPAWANQLMVAQPPAPAPMQVTEAGAATPRHRLMRSWQMSPTAAPDSKGALTAADHSDDEDDAFPDDLDALLGNTPSLREAVRETAGAGDHSRSVTSIFSGSEPSGMEVLRDVVERLRLPREVERE